VRTIAFRHGLSADEVDDVTQDAFLSLAKNLHTIEDPERLPSWLMTTTRRMCWKAVQKRKREHLPEGGDLADANLEGRIQPLYAPLPTMDELASEWRRQEALGAALARLGERCRSLITMLFLDADEPSYDDVSRTTGIPKGSIGPTRIRCLQQLRSILEGLGLEQ
jgi:RNA polymerase sigma factor (sigma-70 family)